MRSKSVIRGRRDFIISGLFTANSISNRGTASSRHWDYLFKSHFFSAYQLLSHYTGYAGESFLFISDLSKADAAWDLGVAVLNILPILMTALNGISSLLYTRGTNRSERYQLWGLALLFLILLYSSPSALVLYWTMNNLFALIKQILGHKGEKVFFLPEHIDKRKVGKILYYGFLSAAVFHSLAIVGYYDRESTTTTLYLAAALIFFLFLMQLIGVISYKKRFESKLFKWIPAVFIAVLIPFQILFTIDFVQAVLRLDSGTGLLISLFKVVIVQGIIILITFPSFYFLTGAIKFKKQSEPSKLRFLLSLSFLVILVFFSLPVQVYSSLPSGFDFSVFRIFQYNVIPLILIFAILFGFYVLIPRKWKVLMEILFASFAVSSFIYAFFIQLNFGSLDGLVLTGEKTFLATYSWYILEYCLLVILVLAIVKLFNTNKRNYLIFISILNLLVVGQTVFQSVRLEFSSEKDISSYDRSLPSDSEQVLGFSKDKNNVIVFMLDMFQGSYISRIMEDNPDLINRYSGFTWFPNTLSISYYTNASLPVLLGGWEFEPVEMGRKPGKNLMEKIVSSYDSLIQQAQNENYSMSFVDPSFYETYRGELTPLREKGATAAYSSQFRNYWEDNHMESSQSMNEAANKSRLLYMIGLFRIVPFAVKAPIYNEGGWLSLENSRFSLQKSDYNHVFSRASFLKSLPILSNTDSSEATFKFFLSELTHTPFGISEDGEIMLDGAAEKEFLSSTTGMKSYYSAYWALTYIGEFLEWLKVNDIYDNSRIILVSDHGIHHESPYVFISHFSNAISTVPGWASLMIVIIFFSGIQLLSLGLIGVYLGRVFDEVKGRPDFIIDKKINF